MKKKVKLIKPNIYLSEKTAIVGSSASILFKKLGKNIDNFGDVIRFNRAQVKNFEEYVGNKTTIRVVNNTIFERAKPRIGWERNEDDHDYIQTLNNIKIITISPHIIKQKIKYKNINKSLEYFFIDKKYYKYLITLYFIKNLKIFINLLKILKSKKNFSVGLYTILLCVISGIKPHLYGFDLNEDMNKRSHYWENGGKVGPYHNLYLEHEITKQLIELNFINMNY
jgi:hypothetical protein|tara:strand:- start:88 stop:762 length:675 start_codon:yes stop_codon:yes gene_type:complete